MNRFFWTVLCVCIGIQLVGCSGWLARTSTSRKARVDQEISGNRGFISGQPTSAPKEPTFTDRKVYKVEIEIPSWSKKQKKEPVPKAPKKDQVLWGNRGYIFGGPQKETAEEMPVTYEQPEAPQVAPVILPILVEDEPERTIELRTYKVRKGDTLQKISRKFYGTTKKWPLLYKVNKSKLKGPDKVYPGQVLVIPEAGEFKK